MISVVLPVFNGLPYLRQAIESVLTQTYGDFELIVINDGSSDGSQALLETFSDSRMRIVQQVNRGLAATLNIGIGQAGANILPGKTRTIFAFLIALKSRWRFWKRTRR